MSKPDAPAAPDYRGAAIEQGAANVEAARTSSKLSNPNFINPYGSQTVTYGGGSYFDQNAYESAINKYNLMGGGVFGKILGSKEPTKEQYTYSLGDPDVPTVMQRLSPEGQALFDQNNRISAGMGNLAEGGISRVGDMLGTQFDMSQVPDAAKAGGEGWQRAYDAITQRNQPMVDRNRSSLDSRLANQGIMQGSEAYQNAMMDQSRSENDFNLGAQQAATGQEQAQFGMDTAARQNAISQQAYLRQLPLNEINALRSGAQVNVPQFQSFSGVNAAAAPIMQGTQAQGQWDQNMYNQQMAGSNAMMSGLFSLGGAALGAPVGTFK